MSGLIKVLVDTLNQLFPEYYCGKCQTQFNIKDNYCKNCGNKHTLKNIR